MRQLNALTRAVTATLRQLLGSRNVTELNRPTIASPWLRRDLFEPLEGRAFTDTPVSPGLSVQYFATLDPTLASSFVAAPTPIGQPAVVTDLTQQWTSNPVDGSTTPFRVRFTGTIDVPDTANGAAVPYYFQLPKAEGAVITIDGQSAILQPSLPGDANLNGSVTFGDYQAMMANYGMASGATWAQGDFTGDGAVTFADYQALNDYYGQTATARTIDNTSDPTTNPFGSVGFSLTPGQHTLQFDLYQFNNSGSPNDQLLYSTDQNNITNAMSALVVSPYVVPQVTPQAVSATAGDAPFTPVATFTQSGPDTGASDYAATIAWSDGKTFSGVIHPEDAGTFSVWSNRYFASAGTLTATVTVTHVASNMSGSATTTATVVAAQLPDAPTGLIATALSPTSVGLVWDHGDYDYGTSVTIVRSGGAYGPVTLYPASNATNSFTDNNLSPHTTYTYSIHATNSVGTSATPTATVTTPTPVPHYSQSWSPLSPSAHYLFEYALRDTPLNMGDLTGVFNSTDTLSIQFPAQTAAGGTIAIVPHTGGGFAASPYDDIYTPAPGYSGLDHFDFTVMDGAVQSQPLRVDIAVQKDSQSELQTRAPYPYDDVAALGTEQSLYFYPPLIDYPMVNTPPTHGTLTYSSDTYQYTYTPDKGFIGRDVIVIGDAQGSARTYTLRIDVYAQMVELLPHRTGLNYGEVVARSDVESGDPGRYVVLVNDNCDEGAPGGAADDTLDTVMPAKDPDLAAINIAWSDTPGAYESSLFNSNDTLTLQLSDPTAVRLFDENGQDLYTAGKGEDGNLVLSNNPTYADTSQLFYPGNKAYVYLEALKPDPNFSLSLVWRDADGNVVAQDSVHMDLVKWSFARKDGQQNTAITETGLGNLEDAINNSSAAAPVDGAFAFASQFDGLSTAANPSLRVYDATNPADSFTDTISNGQSDHWTAAYVSGATGMILTPAERTSLLSKFGLEAVDPASSDAVTAVLNTALDAQVRTPTVNPALWTQVDEASTAATKPTFEQEYRQWIESEFGPNPTDGGFAHRKFLCDFVAKDGLQCSQVDQWPLLAFAVNHALPVQFITDSNQTWTDFNIVNGKLSGGANFNPRALKDKTMRGQVSQFNFQPYNELNWRYDGKAFVHNAIHYTDEAWSVCRDNMNLAANAIAPEIAARGSMDVGNIQVGDIITTANFDGWPMDPKQGDAMHADIITGIDKSTLGPDGKPTVNTKVYLMYNSSHDAKDLNGPWFTIKQLLADGNHDFNHSKPYVIRSLDYASFDKLFDPIFQNS